MTKIERALFIDQSAHWISAFELSQEALTLTIHPCARNDVLVQAHFPKLRILSVDDSYADEDSELPWDIIGFESERLFFRGWRFCIHTDCIEYVFESRWPKITRMA